MKIAGWLLLAGVLGVSVTAGCGGNVVVDPAGSGGSGGGGTGASTGTSTTTGSGTTGVTTTTTSTTLNPPAYCQVFCTEANEAGCITGGEVAECVDGCQQVFKEYAACAAQLKAYYDCFLAGLSNDCGSTSSCDEEANAFGECVNGSMPPCQEYGCDIGMESCYCEGECNNDFISVECKESPNDYYYCNCYVNGGLMASCEGSGGGCGIFDSCCSEYFFP